jgi:PhnB protein
MAAHWLPKDRTILNTCVSAKDAAKLRDFIVRVFDAKVNECHSDDSGVLHHAEARIGDSTVMLGEAGGEWGPQTASFYVYVPDCDATFRRAVAAGAKPVMEPQTMFYGDRHGTVRDAWGNTWSLATHVEDVSEEEMQRRSREYMAGQKAKS